MILYFTQTQKGPNKNHLHKLEKVIEELKPGNYSIRIESNDIVGNPQGRYWAVLKIISIETGYTSNDLHDEYKKMFNKGRSTKTFKSDSQWWDYINQVVMHGRTFHGCNIPEGRDMHYNRLMEIEESYKKSFR